MQIINARTKAIVATDAEMADTREKRNRGLLGRDHLDASSGLVLSPCFMIHTAFMRFPIDVVFVDRYGFAIRIVRNLQPWRIAIAPGARMTIELAAGAVDAHDLQVGDPVYFAPTSSASAAVTAA
jgi:uncharacterized protein